MIVTQNHDYDSWNSAPYLLDVVPVLRMCHNIRENSAVVNKQQTRMPGGPKPHCQRLFKSQANINLVIATMCSV
jgi:hypothetical protein